ncbi:hypothetical protein JW926_04195 [Candidatus Sumerlaeota bacterium]|nr:hypothetical protein [Candidatus Sumerlaeota bacterium]
MRFVTFSLFSVFIVLCILSTNPVHASKVEFTSQGICLVDRKPFFPIGIWLYELNSNVMAEIHDKQFNTIVGGFKPDQLDYIHQHGIKAICFTGEEWIKAAQNHPALLAWYLTDEPESHNKTPEGERARYLALKKSDPNHPIGLCHFLFEALSKYKDACDFTLTDVYPVTANRDVPLVNVGIHVAEARRIHGPDWANWAFIQVFGGPDADGGKWAQPLPHEVRCMAYIALVHGATGILYFSYWQKAPDTWNSLRDLNRELHRIIPWLVAKGDELNIKSSNPQVHVRARKVKTNAIILAVNTSPVFCNTTFEIESEGTRALKELSRNRLLRMLRGRFSDSFGPYEAKAYVWGQEP